MAPLREEAEVLRLGLVLGLVEPGAAVAWADRIIAAAEATPIEVMDVAMASRQPVDEMIRLLGRVPGSADFTHAAHCALGFMRERFIGGGLSLEAAADMLWAYAREANIPEDERDVAASFIHEYHCLVDYFGTPVELGNEITQFLAEHAAAAPFAP